MSFLISSICKTTTRNLLLVRHASNSVRAATFSQSSIQLENYQTKLAANKFMKSSFSTSAPTASAVHDHTKLWTLEKVLSAALIGIVPLAFLTPHAYLDYALALSFVTHIHWGLEAIVIDYIRPRLFGPTIPKISIGFTYLLSILTLAGLYYFNYNDVGLSQAIMMLLKK